MLIVPIDESCRSMKACSSTCVMAGSADATRGSALPSALNAAISPVVSGISISGPTMTGPSAGRAAR
jgi:hypothetical protein